MKKLLLLATLSLAALISAPVGAATTSNTFTVQLKLTPVCTVANATTNGILNYTSFGTAASATATNAAINVKCTTSLPYVATLNGAATTTTNAYNFTDSVGATATNLNYTLTLAATGLSGVGANAGTGTDQAYSVTPTINGDNQSGTCPTPTAGVCSNTVTHTLTITY
jgi:spore coat protein U-like protein